jgi:hypothetical protein
MILSLLLGLTIACFLSHVIMLFTSFPPSGIRKRRYFYSHLTLWLTGVFFYLITWQYANQGISTIIDLFDTPGKRVLILVTAAGLSLVAHSIVRLLVFPQYRRR